MTAEQLLVQCHAENILLFAEGESLRYRVERGELSEARRQELKQHKAELLALLRTTLGETLCRVCRKREPVGTPDCPYFCRRCHVEQELLLGKPIPPKSYRPVPYGAGDPDWK